VVRWRSVGAQGERRYAGGPEKGGGGDGRGGQAEE